MAPVIKPQAKAVIPQEDRIDPVGDLTQVGPGVDTYLAVNADTSGVNADSLLPSDVGLFIQDPFRVRLLSNQEGAKLTLGLGGLDLFFNSPIVVLSFLLAPYKRDAQFTKVESELFTKYKLLPFFLRFKSVSHFPDAYLCCLRLIGQCLDNLGSKDQAEYLVELEKIYATIDDANLEPTQKALQHILTRLSPMFGSVFEFVINCRRRVANDPIGILEYLSPLSKGQSRHILFKEVAHYISSFTIAHIIFGSSRVDAPVKNVQLIEPDKALELMGFHGLMVPLVQSVIYSKKHWSSLPPFMDACLSEVLKKWVLSLPAMSQAYALILIVYAHASRHPGLASYIRTISRSPSSSATSHELLKSKLLEVKPSLIAAFEFDDSFPDVENYVNMLRKYGDFEKLPVLFSAGFYPSALVILRMLLNASHGIGVLDTFINTQKINSQARTFIKSVMKDPTLTSEIKFIIADLFLAGRSSDFIIHIPHYIRFLKEQKSDPHIILEHYRANRPNGDYILGEYERLSGPVNTWVETRSKREKRVEWKTKLVKKYLYKISQKLKGKSGEMFSKYCDEAFRTAHYEADQIENILKNISEHPKLEEEYLAYVAIPNDSRLDVGNWLVTLSQWEFLFWQAGYKNWLQVDESSVPEIIQAKNEAILKLNQLEVDHPKLKQVFKKNLGGRNEELLRHVLLLSLYANQVVTLKHLDTFLTALEHDKSAWSLLGSVAGETLDSDMSISLFLKVAGIQNILDWVPTEGRIYWENLLSGLAHPDIIAHAKNHWDIVMGDGLARGYNWSEWGVREGSFEHLIDKAKLFGRGHLAKKLSKNHSAQYTELLTKVNVQKFVRQLHHILSRKDHPFYDFVTFSLKRFSGSASDIMSLMYWLIGLPKSYGGLEYQGQVAQLFPGYVQYFRKRSITLMGDILADFVDRGQSILSELINPFIFAEAGDHVHFWPPTYKRGHKTPDFAYVGQNGYIRLVEVKTLSIKEDFVENLILRVQSAYTQLTSVLSDFEFIDRVISLKVIVNFEEEINHVVEQVQQMLAKSNWPKLTEILMQVELSTAGSRSESSVAQRYSFKLAPSFKGKVVSQRSNAEVEQMLKMQITDDIDSADYLSAKVAALGIHLLPELESEPDLPSKIVTPEYLGTFPIVTTMLGIGSLLAIAH